MKTTKRKSAASGTYSLRLLQRARQVADGYRLVLEPVDGVGYIGRSVEFPGIMADGKDVVSCATAIKFALETAVAAMLADGKSPPSTMGTRRRTEQINIRLTPDEKDRLAEESAHRGFKGVSDFMRSVALDICRS